MSPREAELVASIESNLLRARLALEASNRTLLEALAWVVQEARPDLRVNKEEAVR